jgi:hypothetical protein
MAGSNTQGHCKVGRHTQEKGRGLQAQTCGCVLLPYPVYAADASMGADQIPTGQGQQPRVTRSPVRSAACPRPCLSVSTSRCRPTLPPVAHQPQ